MNEPTPRLILMIEDGAGDARLLREMLHERGSQATTLIHVDRMSEAEKYLSNNTVDVVLLDLGLPDVQGLDAVRRARAAAPTVPLVVLTGHDNELLAAQALQEGAQDYLIKGQIESRGLLRAIRYAIERKTLDEALFVEKERAQVTLDCIGDAVACSDAQGNLTFFNAAAERMTHWSSREVLGRPLKDVLRTHDGTTSAPSHGVRAPSPSFKASTRMQASPTCTLCCRDGSEIPIEYTLAQIHDRGGLPTGSVLVFRDVSAGRANALKAARSPQPTS